jgi:hypothetical protein
MRLCGIGLRRTCHEVQTRLAQVCLSQARSLLTWQGVSALTAPPDEVSPPRDSSSAAMEARQKARNHSSLTLLRGSLLGLTYWE